MMQSMWPFFSYEIFDLDGSDEEFPGEGAFAQE